MKLTDWPAMSPPPHPPVFVQTLLRDAAFPHEDEPFSFPRLPHVHCAWDVQLVEPPGNRLLFVAFVL